MAQRILWLGVIALGLMGSLGYRVYQLQMADTFRGHDLKQEALAQRRQALPLALRRGQVLDRNGEALHDPVTSYGLGVFPRAVSDKQAVLQGLQAVLTPMQLDLVRQRLAAGQSEPAWALTAGLTPDTVAEIAALRLDGVVAGPTWERYGPGSLARHLVGYGNAQGGQLGLERAFDAQLKGDRVKQFVATFDARNRLMGGEIQVVEPEAGKEPYDLITTIDARIQEAVERELARSSHPAGGPLRAAVVVLDVANGDPLAIASWPNYVQTSIPPDDRYAALVNRAFLAYEPGSVFKPIVAAAALEEGKVTLDEVFDDTGVYELGNLRFRDSDGKAHGQITFREAIARSCNITFIRVGYERLGAERLLEAARRFGLGRPTGIYPGADESSGHLPPLQFGGDVAQFSFGQGGLMATPLQIARAYAAIANDGIMPPLRLVTKVKKPSGEVVERPAADPGGRVISRETARLLQEALISVTDPQGDGTGRAAWVEEGGSAGKTGTAETLHGDTKVTHAWFAGWVPARQPRYVITVLIEDGKSGGLYAAPLFRQIAEAIQQR